MHFIIFIISGLSFLSIVSAWNRQRNLERPFDYLHGRQLPAKAIGVQTLKTPQNITIRYKEPGKEGICETIPGVNSYSGYIDLDENTHAFFWFFEARNNPEEAPVTLWLSGGPGTDSLDGLFSGLGPCNATENLTTKINPYSWSETSNLLFLSQPLGTGFSYSSKSEGRLSRFKGYGNSSYGPVIGRYPIVDATALDTTELAAVAAWHVLQGFFGGLPQLDSNIKSKQFHLWTDSYGGHYGPTFYDYFYKQNQLISNGKISGIPLDFGTLGIGNGLIDPMIQSPSYPEFAMNNTYGIKAISDKVYNYMNFALNMRDGCLEQIAGCQSRNLRGNSDIVNNYICSKAANMCSDNVEAPYQAYSGRDPYDIRRRSDDPSPQNYFVEFLNLASTQNALGVDLNYTSGSHAIHAAFSATGDYAYPTILEDLEEILENGVRVHLYYGDADYMCNWFGGEAISLAVDYTYSEEFAASGYAPFLIGSGTSKREAGEVRQYGNFSFLRVYEAGHTVPRYQPEASLEMFRRAISGLDIATGELLFDEDYSTNGTPYATHTNSHSKHHR